MRKLLSIAAVAAVSLAALADGDSMDEVGNPAVCTVMFDANGGTALATSWKDGTPQRAAERR